MKKWHIKSWAWTAVAILPAIYLTFWGPADSWSGNALLATHWILNVVLIGNAKNFNLILINHPAREDIIYNWGFWKWRIDVRLKHLAEFTEYSFFLVLIFHMGNEYFSNYWHFGATGLAVTGLALIVSGWYKTGTFWWAVFFGSVILGAIALLIAFILHWWDVGYPELFLALVGLVWVHKNKTKFPE